MNRLLNNTFQYRPSSHNKEDLNNTTNKEHSDYFSNNKPNLKSIDYTTKPKNLVNISLERPQLKDQLTQNVNNLPSKKITI